MAHPVSSALRFAQVTISGFDLTSYRDCLTKWSSAVETMFEQCQAAGEDRCLPVRYEQLVLRTEEEMRKLLRFLELPWDPAVLHHEELIGKAGGVSLSKSVFTRLRLPARAVVSNQPQLMCAFTTSSTLQSTFSVVNSNCFFNVSYVRL